MTARPCAVREDDAAETHDSVTSPLAAGGAGQHERGHEQREKRQTWILSGQLVHTDPLCPCDAARQAAAAGPLESSIGSGGPELKALYLAGLGILAHMRPNCIRCRIQIGRNVGLWSNDARLAAVSLRDTTPQVCLCGPAGGLETCVHHFPSVYREWRLR